MTTDRIRQYLDLRKDLLEMRRQVSKHGWQLPDETEECYTVAMHDCRRTMSAEEESRLAAILEGKETPLPESSLLHDWRPADSLDQIPIGSAEQERIRAKAWMNTAREYLHTAEMWTERYDKLYHAVADHIEFASDRGRVLVCPRCGDEHIHHDVVEVLSRAKEDGVGQRLVVMRDGTISYVPIDADSKLWNGRRDELVVEFWCEGCDARSVLHIMQHKGRTLLWMTAVPEPEFVATEDARAVTYCSFAGGEPERCLGVLVLTGAYSPPEEAAKRAFELGLKISGQMLALVLRETDDDVPSGEFEAYWAHRDRLIPVEEARELFKEFGMQSYGEHRAGA